jgi:hypothetical protein
MVRELSERGEGSCFDGRKRTRRSEKRKRWQKEGEGGSLGRSIGFYVWSTGIGVVGKEGEGEKACSVGVLVWVSDVCVINGCG